MRGALLLIARPWLIVLLLLASVPSLAQCPTLNLGFTSATQCYGSAINVPGNTFGGGATSVTLSHNGSGTLSSGTVAVSPFNFSYIPSAADNGNIVTITLTTNNPAGPPCTPAVKTFSLTVTAPPVLNVVNPPDVCQPNTVNITAPSVTPGSTGTLSYWTNATATTPLANPAAIAVSGTYYIKAETSPGCSVIQPVSVIVNVPATTAPVLFCDAASPNTTPNSVSIDFNNSVPPQLYFAYSYTIDGGPPITGTHVAPSNFTVTGLQPGQSVTFTLTWVGICTPPKTVTCTSECITTTTTQFAPIAPICQGSTPPALPTTSANGVVGTWSPATIDTSVSGTTAYVFSPVNACATTFTQNIVITPATVPVFAPIGPLCQNSTPPALPTTSTNGITGTWNVPISTASVGTTNYIFTPNSGQCAAPGTVSLPVVVQSVATPVFTQQPPVCSGTNVTLPTTSNNGITGTWSPAFNPNATTLYTFTPTGSCSSSTTMTVTVNPSQTPNFASVAPLCQNEVPPYALPSVSPNGITGSWSPATVNTTVAATTTHVFTPSTPCANPQNLTITVNPRKTIDFSPVLSICQGNTPPPLQTTSPQGITGTWTPSVIDTSVTGTTNYTFNATGGQCINASSHIMAVTVEPRITPDFPPLGPYCAGTAIAPLPTTSPNGVQGTWNLPINNMATTTYTFIPLSTECADQQTMTIQITPRPVPQFALIAPFCEGSAAPVLPTTSIDGFTGTWSPATVSNSTSDQYTFTPDPGQCADIALLNITVTPPQDPGFEDISICVGASPPMLPPTSPNGVQGSWSPASINNTASAAYVFTPDTGDCAVPQTIQVTVNQETLIAIDYTVSPAFANNGIITVLATDPGNYLYQLDNGPLQPSNVFQNVPQGEHTVTVYDANGCSLPLKASGIQVIGYPAYFTPNGDNIHDTWTINGLPDAARIYIFDRYGKLIKQIAPNGPGWDGTYNGKPLPSTDYWFSVDYYEDSKAKTFRSNFSLKR